MQEMSEYESGVRLGLPAAARVQKGDAHGGARAEAPDRGLVEASVAKAVVEAQWWWCGFSAVGSCGDRQDGAEAEAARGETGSSWRHDEMRNGDTARAAVSTYPPQ